MSTVDAASRTDDRQAPSAEFFEFMREWILTRSAMVLEPGKEYLVDSRLSHVLKQFDLDGFDTLMRLLKSNPTPELEESVVDNLTVNETSFFRDRHPFDALRDQLIPEIMANKGPTEPLIIWCGASSSGQEPYTLAMLLHEKFPELVEAGRVRIVATDISPTMVARCRAGRFSQFEVNRGLPAPLLLKYFVQEGREWVASNELRKLIACEPLNLIGRWAVVPRSDLVMLRNVLIYFPMDVKIEILQRIRRDVLKPRGVLMLGGSETTLNLDDGYERVTYDRTSIYRPKADS